MQAHSLFLPNTLPKVSGQTPSPGPPGPPPRVPMHILRRNELPKKIQLHGFSIKEKNKKCKTLAGAHWFLSRDFLNVCRPFLSTRGCACHKDGSPADTTGSPNQAPGRAQGKALPGTDTPKVMPCPSSWSRGLQRRQSRLRATSRVLRKEPIISRPVKRSWPPWPPVATPGYPEHPVLAVAPVPLCSPIWAELRLHPKSLLCPGEGPRILMVLTGEEAGPSTGSP